MAAKSWAHLFEQIGDTCIDGVRVSTIFVAVPNRMFETMILGGPLDEERERYSTREAAVAGHASWVKHIQQGER